MKNKIIVLALICGVLLSGCGKKEVIATKITTVVTKKIQPTVAVNTQAFSGVIKASETVSILSEVEAVTKKINVVVGDNVVKGQVLAQLDDTINKARYEQAKSSYELTKQTYERQSALYKEAVISKQQYETYASQYKQAESSYIIAKKSYEDCQIKAPIYGSIAVSNLVVGGSADRKTPAFVMVNYAAVEIPFGVTDREIAKITKGKKVTVTIDTLPGKSFTGVITSVGMLADERTGTYPIKAKVSNPKYLIKPGMIAQVKVPLDYAAKAKVVPIDSIVLNGETKGIFTVSGNIAAFEPVKIIFEFGDNAYVSSNFQYGQMLVIKGQNNIVDGEEVAATGNVNE